MPPTEATNGAAHPPIVMPAKSPRASRTVQPAAAVKEEHAGAVTLSMAFAEVGHVVRGLLPAKPEANERAAAEYWGASVAARLAEAWREKAKRQAVALGVLPSLPFKVGTVETVYAGSLVTIGVKVVEQADRVDAEALLADLAAAGVKPTLLKRLRKKHTRSFAGAQIFTATLT